MTHVQERKIREVNLFGMHGHYRQRHSVLSKLR
jgi:hypothetical protein